MCNCCKQEMAAACTRESEWSCIMAQPTRQEERMVEMVAPFPENNMQITSCPSLEMPITVHPATCWPDTCIELITPKKAPSGTSTITMKASALVSAIITLQFWPNSGDEGTQTAAQALVHLSVRWRHRQEQRKHQGKGRFHVPSVHRTARIHNQSQGVQSPCLMKKPRNKVRSTVFFIYNTSKTYYQVKQDVIC